MMEALESQSRRNIRDTVVQWHIRQILEGLDDGAPQEHIQSHRWRLAVHLGLPDKPPHQIKDGRVVPNERTD